MIISDEVPPGVDPERWTAIRDRLRKTTPGPWSWSEDTYCLIAHAPDDLAWALVEIQYHARTSAAAQKMLGKAHEREDKAKARVKELEAERDAYKRAKAENDERFMLERDEARAEAARLRRTVAEVEAALRDAFLGVNNAAGNLEYVAKSLSDHVEGVVQRARVDIETMVAKKSAELGD